MIRRSLVRLAVWSFALVGLVILGLTIAGALYTADTAIPSDLAGKRVDLNGVPLRVLQIGHGRDVLLIHGSSGSVEDWAPVMDALAGSFRLTAYDRPGHGFSGDTGKYSYEHNADVALDLIGAQGLEDVVVVGHSYGGGTALAMAVRTPASVGAYVIVDSAAYTPSREVNTTYRLLAVRWLGTGVARALGSERVAKRIESGIAEQFGGRTPEAGFVELRSRIWSTPKVLHALAVETLGAREGLRQLSPKYPEIRRPVFIVGQADNEFRRMTAERLYRDVAGSVLKLVPGTGHYIQIEKPSVVVDAIREAAQTL
jgi:pimeloyl-ACP methyl ester carboxylesterase